VLKNRDQIALGFACAGPRFNGENGTVIERPGHQSGIGVLGRPEGITARRGGQAREEVAHPGDADLLDGFVSFRGVSRKRPLGQKPLPVRSVQPRRRIEQTAEVVTEISIQMEKEIAEKGFAPLQMETERSRRGKFRGVQHAGFDLTDQFDR